MSITGHGPTLPEGGTHYHRQRVSPNHYYTHQGREISLTYPAAAHPHTRGAPQWDEVKGIRNDSKKTEAKCRATERVTALTKHLGTVRAPLNGETIDRRILRMGVTHRWNKSETSQNLESHCGPLEIASRNAASASDVLWNFCHLHLSTNKAAFSCVKKDQTGVVRKSEILSILF
ncbi:hypothetical protein AVEN_5546-1 [Araneus ventricosus]|uniref:Uncharacterized protein n=1 Tax=Araneus ventricosus TaxID=182803 RepID=A0A4Y2DWL0_ARAVE|nr:hypothetical protein AVEN_5546-1 [Araneus ventricosus]